MSSVCFGCCDLCFVCFYSFVSSWLVCCISKCILAVLYGWVSCTVSLLFVPLCTSLIHRLSLSFTWQNTLNRLLYQVLRQFTHLKYSNIFWGLKRVLTLQNKLVACFAVSVIEMRLHKVIFSGCVRSRMTLVMSDFEGFDFSVTWWKWIKRCSCSVNIQAFYDFSVPRRWCPPAVFDSLVFVLYIPHI